MYHFRQIDRPEAALGTGKRLSPGYGLIAEDISMFSAYQATFRGSLLQLFGESLTPAGDAVYEYVIEASDDEGHTWILTAYHGASGAAIGGKADAGTMQAASALLKLIDSTPPLDFEETHYDPEYDSTITWGCRDGAGYWYEARGEQEHVTEQQHLEREARERAEHEEYMERCEAEDICYVCDGTGFDGTCPECRGGGKLSDWRD